MKLNEYQEQALRTAIGATTDLKVLLYRTLGLNGEAGEVAEKVKKILRDKDGKINETDKQEIVKELGDVLWYLQAIADYLGVSLEEVAQKNIEKLSSRKKRNLIHGSGDNR